MSTQVFDTVVIGAGIAGLVAAWRLRAAGREVLVLEAAAQAGGRMCSHRRDGCIIDSGAQFLSSGYRLLPALATELGLVLEPVRSPRHGLLRDGRWRVLRGDSRVDAWRQGLLGLRSWLKFGALHWRHRRALSAWDLGDYSAWAAFDDEDTASWLRREVGDEVLDAMIEPLLEGLYFQQADDTSKALTLAVLAFAWRRHQALALRDGMDRLPKAMASQLPIRYGVSAARIEAERDAVRIDTSERTLYARRLVCAVPAPQAAALWPAAPALERELLATPYSATINIALILHGAYRLPAALRDVYGAFVPRSERTRIAALAIENHKHGDRATGATLVNVMLSDAAASQCLASNDDTLLRDCATELEHILPHALRALEGVVVSRWPLAEPRSPVGRATALARYRDPRRACPSILLAGDYMGMPYTEGAAVSGAWAAARLQQA